MNLAPALVAAAAAGLVSAPHCAAMCGPLALTACESPRSGARYALGRLASYMLTGAVAGAVGSGVLRALRGEGVQRAASLALALGLALAAWRVLRGGGPAALGQLRRAPARRRVPPVVIGLATGLLPCGALASGLLVAAGAATWWGGALAMATFALASAPGLLAVVLPAAGLRAALWRAATPTRRRAAAAVMVIAAGWVAVRPWVMPERTCHCQASAAERGG
jgi:uncharacterized protein